ncbi:MAG TPA: IS4 family transposase [Candidatus Paceibacterota bacterium]|nr:IS4 family transposase [Candidatus Paceibacterota bacterium]
MRTGKTIFSQVMEWIHPEQFRRCVQRYRGNYRVRRFPCWDQFLAMSFAQLTYRDSLADIEVCLRSRPDQLYHMGFRSTIAHNTLATANRVRDWRIYHDLAQRLIARARRLYADESFGVELAQTVYALDSTTIDLCLSLFPWARFRSTKAAVKLHTLLDLRGPIPTMISISQGKQADVNVLDELILEPGAFYVMDRGYVDFERLYRFVLAGAFFVTRAKAGLRVNRLESRPADESTGVRSDQIVWLTLPKSIAHYPDRFRRVSYRDLETDKALVFLTNNFDLPPLVVAQLYKSRWRIELFFKWVKQNLRIKHFFGTTDNAVKTQVWIAVCVYVLVAIVRKELGLELSLSQLLQVFSVNVFEQMPLAELVAKTASQNETFNSRNQLVFNLF